MQKLQQIKNNQQSKYNEIIEYLKQDDRYWLENDKWDLTKEFFIGKKIRRIRYINFSSFKNETIKNEIKFYILFNFKENLLKNSVVGKLGQSLKRFSIFSKDIHTISNLDKEKTFIKWKLYLINEGIKYASTETRYFSFTNVLIDFIKDFYDDRDETEKDIWYSKNIIGARIPASGVMKKTNPKINFANIPIYYRETVKRYFKTIITKKSWSYCCSMSNVLKYFFNKFYSNGYSDGFLKELSRQDIENYLYWVNNDHKNKNATYKSEFISYVRKFLEYILSVRRIPRISHYRRRIKIEILIIILILTCEYRKVLYQYLVHCYSNLQRFGLIHYSGSTPFRSLASDCNILQNGQRPYPVHSDKTLHRDN